MTVATHRHWWRHAASGPTLLLAGMLISLAVARYGLLNNYVQLVLMYVGINIILATSLNLVNGYMGEFSLAHAGFMAAGAYSAALLTQPGSVLAIHPALFPVALLVSAVTAGFLGFLVALPSFRVRGDYLAIITLAFLMIMKSALENLDIVGGPRGLSGIPRLTNLPVVFVCVVLCVGAVRNFVYSRFGRGVLAIREDDIACALMSVDTRQVKRLAFMLSAACAGVAGGLFAHLLQFISPRVFDVIKTTEILIMVYLGGIASIMGSIIGATVYTVGLELLRPSTFAALFAWLPPPAFALLDTLVIRHLGVLRMIIMPLMLVLVMLYWPRGLMGLREWRGFVPARERDAHRTASERRGVTDT